MYLYNYAITIIDDIFSKVSETPLTPPQTPIQWIIGALSPEVKMPECEC